MKKIVLLLIILTNIALVNAQFTIVPTSDDRFITGLVMHGDTLVVKGSTDYLGKSYDMGANVVEVQDNLPLNIVYQDFQIVDDVYYMYGQTSLPYYVSVVRSKDFGLSWDTLHHESGLFGGLAVYDSTKAILGGLGGGRITAFSPFYNGWHAIPPFVGGGFADAKYLNQDTCFLLGSLFSVISYDAGANWNYTTPSGGSLTKVQFVGGDTIYAAGGSNNLKFEYSYTLGGGTVPVLYDDTGYFIEIYNMWFDNSMHGYLLGNAEGVDDTYPKCAIFETFDRGLTWTQHQLEYDGTIACVTQANDSIFFLGGADPWQNSLLLKWNRNQPFQTLGLDLKQKDNSFLIYPNPVKNEVQIESPLNLTGKEKIQVYDLTGKLVNEMAFQKSINVESLNTGVYIISIISDNQVLARSKFIKD